MSRRALDHETRVYVSALAAGLPAIVVALFLLGRGETSARVFWTLAFLVVSVWLGFAAAARGAVVHQLQTVANLLAALREGDFSVRGRHPDAGDALGGLLAEVNALGETLRTQRLGAVEAAALLSKVMAEIDVAVFAFDQSRRLQLVNRAGEELLGSPAKDLLGKTAESMDMAALLEGEPERRVDTAFGLTRRAWELRRGSFRQGGVPHQLVVLTDLQRARREEERHAWQRLVRVLGHEINNSLAPIQSIAESLRLLVRRQPRPPDWDEDLARGLDVIERRAQALGRFLLSYAKLAKLPPPRLAHVGVSGWVQRMAELEKRTAVTVIPGPAVSVLGDGDQLDQMLINILRNAVDASLETAGRVTIGWRLLGNEVELVVTDEGPGIADSGNLFVPFFTTKPGGSGIGLVLSRQIAEGHRGHLELRNRADRTGCEAVVRLPWSS